MFRILILFCLLFAFGKASAQPNFKIEIEELPPVPSLALHSFACAQFEGKWLLIGGRKNGLHGFLPPLAFPNNGRNTDFVVFDPATNSVWTHPVASLPDSIREAITTSNMQFVQRDSLLYMVGGYGWNADAGTFITYPTLTVVHVPGLVDAVQNSLPVSQFFRQVRHDSLAICGAHLADAGTHFQLVFGHRFDGIYDRQDTTGFHAQTYSHAIRPFEVVDQGGTLSINWLGITVDTLNFRRRDYNLVPQVFPDGSLGHTAFSGVFQKGINLPYLFPIDIWADSARPRLSFDQQLANYHCAVLPLHDSAGNRMHTVFFGGEAQYRYDSSGTLIMDTLVPFVNTISVVTRDDQWGLSEYRIDTVLPGLLGSNAQFFPDHSQGIPTTAGIIRLDKLTGRTLVGHVMGGIESPAPNISDTDPSQSWASERWFRVFVTPNTSGINAEAALPPFSVQAYPNPFQTQLRIEISGEAGLDMKVDMLDANGNPVGEIWSGISKPEMNLRWKRDVANGVYFLRVQGSNYQKLLRVLKVGP